MGNLIEIRHDNNLKTLYAHMNSFASGIKAGKRVKRGQFIGRVGTTGLSTGPHLHFGLYRNNSPINPLSNVKAVHKELQAKEKEVFNAHIQEFIQRLDAALKNQTSSITPNESFNIPAETIENTDSTETPTETDESAKSLSTAQPTESTEANPQ